MEGTPQVPAAPLVGRDLAPAKEPIVRVLVVEKPPPKVVEVFVEPNPKPGGLAAVLVPSSPLVSGAPTVSPVVPKVGAVTIPVEPNVDAPLPKAVVVLGAPKKPPLAMLDGVLPPKLVAAAPEAGLVELRVGTLASTNDVRISARLGNADSPRVAGAPNLGQKLKAAFGVELPGVPTTVLAPNVDVEARGVAPVALPPRFVF